MKKKILIIASLICLFGFNTACNDNNINTKDENNLLQEETSLVEIWKCTPELHPNFTITLAVDSENNVYVTTNPKDGNDVNMIIAPWMYMFADNTNFIIVENKMHHYYDKDNYDELSGFEIIKLSKNTMQLKYFGAILAYDKIVTEYLFTKINEESEDTTQYPTDISFWEYSLIETSCKWTNLNYDDKMFIINRNEELESYISCSDGNFPAIDFSKYTLLLASGTTPNGIVKTSNRLLQLSANKYELDVEILLNEAFVMQPWIMALIVNKLNQEDNIELNVTLKKN